MTYYRLILRGRFLRSPRLHVSIHHHHLPSRKLAFTFIFRNNPSPTPLRHRLFTSNPAMRSKYSGTKNRSHAQHNRLSSSSSWQLFFFFGHSGIRASIFCYIFGLHVFDFFVFLRGFFFFLLLRYYTPLNFVLYSCA